MPIAKKSKNKKTKGGDKAKRKPTKSIVSRAAEKKKPKTVKRRKKTVTATEELKIDKIAPKRGAAFSRRPEFDVDTVPKESRREELNRLIEQESIGEQGIFSNKEGESEVDEAREPRPVIRPVNQPPSEKIYMTNGDSVSIYRKILLWTSVGMCAVVIIFGWVLTIGGSLGLKQVDAEYIESSRLNELTEEIKNELEDVRDDLREANKNKLNVNDTLENIVEEISAASSTTEEVGEEGRDIFSPPATATEEII